MSDSPGESSRESLSAPAQLITMASGYVVARAVHAFAELGMADHLRDGQRSAEELARTTDTHAPSLYRLLRACAALGLVEEEKRRFSLTTLGQALRSDAPGHALSTVRAMAAPGMWRAFGDFLHAVQSGEPVLARVGGGPVFGDMSSTPEQAIRVNETQLGFAGDEPHAITEAYDFSTFGTLVDVDGNTGNLLTTVLLANPVLRGIVYDLPHVVPEAKLLITNRGLEDRCAAIGGSFFDSVPSGGDGYLLSKVVHDWPVEQCLVILRNIRRVIPPNGRLLLAEQVIPPGNDEHPAKWIDLILLTITGGMERTVQQYTALLARAGFRVVRVVPTRLTVSVIEAEPL